MISIGSVLDRNRGHGPGFDALRVGLSISVLSFHSFNVCYGGDAVILLWHGAFRAAAMTVLPMFFALSGFLVIGSALRTRSLKTFLVFRGLRIVPALFTETVLSAFILGPLLTTTPLVAYFTNRHFFGYLGNIVGRIRWDLPGVFETNPYPAVVNRSLWTIQPELACYGFMAAFIVGGVYLSRRWMTMIGVAFCGGLPIYNLFVSEPVDFMVLPGQYLVLCFIFGNLTYLWRDHIPCSSGIFTFSTIVGIFCLSCHETIYIGMLFLTYTTIYLGLLKIPNFKFFKSGDYSYGIYLYSFPIQQTVCQIWPWSREWYLNIVVSLPFILAIAFLSWVFIEKPALNLRKLWLPVRPVEPATAPAVV